MRCTGVSFTHEVGGRINRRAGLRKLLAVSEIEVEKGDIVEVTLKVTPKDMLKKGSRLERYVRKLKANAAEARVKHKAAQEGT